VGRLWFPGGLLARGAFDATDAGCAMAATPAASVI